MPEHTFTVRKLILISEQEYGILNEVYVLFQCALERRCSMNLNLLLG